MPNHPSSRYEFEHGFQMWLLDREQTQIKSEISHCKSEQAALEAAEKKELERLSEKYSYVMLLNVNKKTKDHHITRKLQDIWAEQQQMSEDLEYFEDQLDTIKDEIVYYMHSKM